jgi:hypothetical protein
MYIAPTLVGLGLCLAATGVVAKDAVVMVNIDNPDRSPYAEFASTRIDPPFVNGFINFPTPKGSRYIIEQVGMTCTTPSNTDVVTQAQLVVTKPSGTGSISFGSPVIALEKRGASAFGSYIWTGSASVKVITEANPSSADGSGALYFNVFHSDFTVSLSCTATLFGHSLALAAP